MLDNFMELVFAMVVGTSRKHIAATIERYHQIQGVVQRSEGSAHSSQHPSSQRFLRFIWVGSCMASFHI